MDPRAQEIWDSATDIQKHYIKARLIHSDLSKATRALKLHRSTPYKWGNLDELEEAVDLLLADTVDATALALEGISLKAVEKISKVLDHGSDSAVVNAAKAIWDRIGLPAMSHVDMTSGGKPIKATIYIPDNGRD